MWRYFCTDGVLYYFDRLTGAPRWKFLKEHFLEAQSSDSDNSSATKIAANNNNVTVYHCEVFLWSFCDVKYLAASILGSQTALSACTKRLIVIWKTLSCRMPHAACRMLTVEDAMCRWEEGVLISYTITHQRHTSYSVCNRTTLSKCATVYCAWESVVLFPCTASTRVAARG